MRVEAGIRTGDVVTPHYDSMIAKLIAWGEDRPTALRRLARAVEATCLLGIPTNQAQLSELLQSPEVQAGNVHTGLTLASQPRPASNEARIAAVVDSWLRQSSGADDFWRNNPGAPAPVRFEGELEPVQLRTKRPPSTPRGAPIEGGGYELEGKSLLVLRHQPPELVLEVDGYRHSFLLAWKGLEAWVWSIKGVARVTLQRRFPPVCSDGPAHGSLRAPLTGSVLEICVAVGDSVDVGQPLLRLTAMKMEHTLTSPRAASVMEIFCQVGEVVEADKVLLLLDNS